MEFRVEQEGEIDEQSQHAIIEREINALLGLQ
jgi:hypothetical protein